jgi:hypothetical protein
MRRERSKDLKSAGGLPNCIGSRGVFLTGIGADETQIEASFRAAIRTAKEQKSVSLEKRAEGTYTEYRRQKASESGGRGFRLPLW